MTTTNTSAATAATAATTAYNKSITEMYGLPRMEDAEPGMPFNTVDTPRPSATGTTDNADNADNAVPSFSAIFAREAKNSASKMKHRRSLRTRTHYCLTASSRVQKAFKTLSNQNEKTQELSPSDFALLKTALDRYRVRLDVGDRMTVAELRTMLFEVRSEEKEAERVTLATFRDNAEYASAAEAEAEAIKYCEAREKYGDLKYWRETLVKEEMRITPIVMPNWGGVKKSQDALPLPTQHAQIAASAGAILRNILNPETIRHKAVSLKVLTTLISEEVANFLTDGHRYADRVEVIRQIRGVRPPTAGARGVPPPNGGNYVL